MPTSVGDLPTPFLLLASLSVYSQGLGAGCRASVFPTMHLSLFNFFKNQLHCFQLVLEHIHRFWGQPPAEWVRADIALLPLSIHALS